MPGRWDHLFDQKPVPIVEHVKDEVSKLLAKELLKWPPPMDELEPGYVQKHSAVFEPGSARPKDALFIEAFRLARWEMERELSAIDDYMRNSRYLERTLEQTDRSALLVLSRWLTEQMLALSEATEGRLKRRDLVDILERTERRLGLKPILIA